MCIQDRQIDEGLQMNVRERQKLGERKRHGCGHRVGDPAINRKPSDVLLPARFSLTISELNAVNKTLRQAQGCFALDVLSV